MSKKDSDAHTMLAQIVSQLAELNERLSRDPEELIRAAMPARKTSLFGFDMDNITTADEYRRYFTYHNTITDILNSFGLHIGNNGYSYIVDAVKIVIDRNTHDLRMKTDVYALIALRHRIKNPPAVEHSIRNAINSAYDDNLRDPGINSMGAFSHKPTCKQFIMYVSDAVVRHICESMAEMAG